MQMTVGRPRRHVLANGLRGCVGRWLSRQEPFQRHLARGLNPHLAVDSPDLNEDQGGDDDEHTGRTECNRLNKLRHA
ncbi:hypothetical protein K5X85_29020 [Streptomyces sp. A144]|uniref:hypothetical protein n=1 Tax=Streptomyces sp. A144 TaxID=2871487 RepID=UPI001CBD81A1|nr:hypothetical protein [Streptomyces sp. A144]UAX56771.1 hypothetical protein K5X85_29020 [Streptomyces sp. A144]